VNKADGQKSDLSRRDRRIPKRPVRDEKIIEKINYLEGELQNSLKPVEVRNFNGFQRKQIYRYFERSQEYKIKTYKEDSDVIIKIYPAGGLQRFAEQKAQEVLMKREPEILLPMGSFERFIIHDYLKDREGIKTESFGKGKERHIEIHPIFGRSPRRSKKRLT
jgi:hypothetical protein